ncbi:autotransporter outer membrane beta-barrel domain-containing protein [Enterobacteriaceae bacterium ML5]|nr:autotransporter outer membrane beta-barrel domain-containing protein [Enterobacteriaceae bacterium ML5]
MIIQLNRGFQFSLLTQLIIYGLASPAFATNDYVVSDGTQTLQLNEGDALIWDEIRVTNTSGEEASLTINGAGNPQDPDRGTVSSNRIHIGYDGAGNLNVDNGASITTDQIAVGMGFWENGTGNLNVDNGASITAQDILIGGGGVGNFGTGNLNVDNSASITAQNIIIGGGDTEGSGTGSLNVDNSASITAENILVGYAEEGGYGTGNLNVSNSASITAENIFVGGGNTGGYGIGSLDVDNGADVTANNISVGYPGGQGSITIRNNALLESGSNISIYNGSLNIGAANGDAPKTAGQIVTASGGVELFSEYSSSDSYAGQIYFNLTDTDYQFAPDITGNGLVSVLNGNTTLLGDNTYAGNTIISGGSLRAGREGTFSGNSNYFLAQNSVMDLNGFSQTIGTLSSSGTIYLNSKGNTAGTALTVNGDYHGSGGTVVFNTALAGDNSVTDTLHVTGNADGGTNVKVNNIGGTGAQTVEGIRLITIGGNIAEGTEFRQVGRIVAGAYDYRLVKGGGNENYNSWYLTSDQLPPDPLEPIAPLDPEFPDIPKPIPTPPVSRPEAGSYITNLSASEMFFTRMEDRGNEYLYRDALTGEQKQTSIWLHSAASYIKSNDSSSQLNTREQRYVAHLGGDLTSGSFNGLDSWRLGMMAGYGTSSNNTHSDITGYRSKGRVDGYSAGLYGSWFENADRRSGLWVDIWLQYAWLNNSVQGEGLRKEKYRSGGLQTSVETGYAIVLPAGNKLNYIIEPQAQIIHNGVKAKDRRENNGTVVKSQGHNNIHTRLGMKGAVEIFTSQGISSAWEPYAELNWHHNTKEYGVNMDDVILASSGTKNTGEIKIGIEGQLTRNLKVYGGTSARVGSDNFRDLGGMFGVRFGF